MNTIVNMKGNRHYAGVSAGFPHTNNYQRKPKHIVTILVAAITALLLGFTTLLDTPTPARADEDGLFQGIPYYILEKDEAIRQKTDPIRIKMEDGTYSFDEWAYCIEANKKLPPAGQYYAYNIYQYGSNRLNKVAESFDTPKTNGAVAPEAGVALALLRGFPNDYSGIKDKYGLSDLEFYKVTQDAVHFWTDSAWQGNHNHVYNSETATRPDVQGKAFVELINDSYTADEILALSRSRFIQAIPHDDEGADWQRLMWLEPGYEVNLSKVDASTNQALPGASLKLLNGPSTDSPLYIDIDTGFQGTFTTSNSPVTLALLEGTYTLVEDKAPEGYKTADPITFEVSRERTSGPFKTKLEIVNPDGTTAPIKGDTVIMKDQPLTPSTVNVTLSKKAGNNTGQAGSSELAGAHLKVITTDEEQEAVHEWVSGDQAQTITLEPGNYQLIETKAPNGYTVAAPIDFRVTADGELEVKTATGTWEKKNDLTVVMVDQPAGPFPITFKKVNDNGQPLTGARFKVTGKRFTGETVNGAFTILTNGAFTWNNLYPGTYTIYEENPPNGYTKLTQPQPFTVASDGRLSFRNITVYGYSLDTTDTNGRTMIIKNEAATPNVSKVQIVKEVQGEFGDKNQDFTFHLKVNPGGTLPTSTPLTWTKYHADGRQVATGIITAGATAATTVTLKHGQYIELTSFAGGIPTGNDRVSVWEDASAGYVTTVLENGQAHPNPSTATTYDVVDGQVNSIVFTNTRDITPTGVTTSMAGYVIAFVLAGGMAVAGGLGMWRMRRRAR